MLYTNRQPKKHPVNPYSLSNEDSLINDWPYYRFQDAIFIAAAADNSICMLLIHIQQKHELNPLRIVIRDQKGYNSWLND